MAAVTDLVRVGVVGLGTIAQVVHLPMLARRYDLFEIGAVCDLSDWLRADVGTSYGIPADRQYRDLGSMLEGADLDAVLLLTSGSHGGQALEVLKRGVPLFCEKPLAYTVAEADALIHAERTLGRPSLALGYMKEHDDAVSRLRERLADIDGIRAVDVSVLHPSGDSQLAFANLRPPAGDVDAGALGRLLDGERTMLDAAVGADTAEPLRDLYSGVLLGSIVHNISLVRSLFGGLTAVDRVHAWPDAGRPPSVEVSGTLTGGARVRVAWHYLPDYPVYRETLTVHHARGSLELRFGTPYLVNAPTELVEVTAGRGGHLSTTLRSTGEAFENELVDFHRMVVTGARPRAGIAEGREDIVTSQRILQQLAAGRGVAIGGEAATA